jgi:hypothetical protein
MIDVRTLSMTSAFRLIDGLPELVTVTNMQPSLKWSSHSLSHPIASSSKACWTLRNVSPLVSPSFWQNVMQYHCSKCSVILREKRMRQTRVTPLCYLAATEESGGVVRQQKLTRAWKSLLPLCSVSPPFRHYLPREKN